MLFSTKETDMPETASPTQVFHRLVHAIAERRQSEIVDECYAEDVVVEHPFMIPEPTTTKGREQLRARMTNLKNLPITMEIADIVVPTDGRRVSSVAEQILRELAGARRR